MGATPFDVVPSLRREAVRAAVASLDAPPVQEIAPIAGGASGALTYRAKAGHRSYLVRVETARDPFRNPMRSYTCMRAAAVAGLAPALHYADPQEGIAIMDFVAARSLDAYPGGISACIGELGRMVARLQTTPVFPPLLALPDMLERMLHLVCSAGLFRAGTLSAHTDALAGLCAAYPWGASPLVSSHNDINPGNVLFDGERLWLIDWELAFSNEPLFDLALIAINVEATAALEHELLTAYLGCAPEPAMRARFALMRTLGLSFYACLMLSTCIGSVPAEDAPAPLSLAELQSHTAARLVRAEPVDLHRDGKMLLAGFLASCRSPAVEDALRDVHAV